MGTSVQDARSDTPAGRFAGRLAACAVLACGLPAPGCAPGPEAEAQAPHFVDAAAGAGIDHVHQKPVLDPVLGNIMPWMASVGAAAAAGDADGDGDVDLYVTQSRKGVPNLLYRNDGDGTFTEVARDAGLAVVNDDGGVSMDVVWADVDNDGDSDLYLVRWGRDRLFVNERGGFRDVTAERFVAPDGAAGTPWANGNAVVALDFDRDGRLDFYVGNYFRDVDLWRLETTRIMHDSFEVARNAGSNSLYHQRPDGRFVDVGRELGVDDTGWTLAVGSADLNNDGWPDLYSANDFGPDRLFYNDGEGGFVDVSELALGHDTRKGMNVDVGDFNNDGWLDVYVTNITTDEYLQEGNMLWRNNGPDETGLVRFMDVSPESGTYHGGWGWGAKFLDHDHDGDLDLFTVNGFISAGDESYWYDLASWTVLGKDPADSRNWPVIDDRSFSGYERFRFWANVGHERFRERAAAAGLASDRDGRGIVVFDYDDDGDQDLFVANQGQPPHLFRNDGAEGHWLTIDLVADPATGTNADAVGARVTAVTERTQIRERDGGNGFAGQSDPRLHFGLGRAERVALLEVRWPDGGLQYLEDVEADRRLTVRQDPQAYVAAPLVEVGRPETRASSTPPAVARPAVDPAELERLLAPLEAALREEVDHRVAHAYRKRCVEHGRRDRAVRFFEEIVEERPDDARARLELSVAYIDEIPTCGGIATIVCKGTLARKSLDQLDVLVAADPDSWIAHYARGTNHLHWPRALRHLDDAIADFSTCLMLQRERGEDRRPWALRTYVLLGDAYARRGDEREARRVWSEGLARFPRAADLRKRLAIAPGGVREWVDERRSLERPIDTDLSFVDWRAAPDTPA